MFIYENKILNLSKMTDKTLNEECMALEPILSDELYNLEIEKVAVIVSVINDKSKISKIVDFLSKNIPLNQLSHLKRIKSHNNTIEVIIGLEEDRNQWLTEEVNKYLSVNNLLPLKTTIVSKYLPKTKRQFESGSKLWPINFHPNTYLEKCLNSTLFDTKGRKIIFDLISKAMELSRESDDHKPSMAAVVTDSNHRVIISCRSEVKINPLRHATLVAIDRVSQLQSSDKENPSDESVLRNGDYLCTGYDFYLSCEPCLMCAMALVHSRIRRLFFLDSEDYKNSVNDCSDRAITLHKFHLLPKLNHHFESWKINFK